MESCAYTKMRYLILVLLLGGCATRPLTENERIAQAQIIASGFQNGGAIIAQGATRPQYIVPYQPMYSPAFNPVPITSANPYGVVR